MHGESRILGDDPIRLWVPIELEDSSLLAKGEAGMPDAVIIRGVCTAQVRDLDGETVMADGIDWSPFMRACPLTGHPLAQLTWGHPNRGTNVIGRGRRLERVQVPDPSQGGALVPGWALTGVIATTGHLGKEAYRQHTSLVKAGLPGIGYSIEGNATQRDPADRSRILKSVVHSVAVDPGPRNQVSMLDPGMEAFVGMMKGALASGSSEAVFGMLDAFAKAMAAVGSAFTMPAPTTPDDALRADLLKGITNDELRALRVQRRDHAITYPEALDFVRQRREQKRNTP